MSKRIYNLKIFNAELIENCFSEAKLRKWKAKKKALFFLGDHVIEIFRLYGAKTVSIL